jgi:hypothetical protein
LIRDFNLAFIKGSVKNGTIKSAILNPFMTTSRLILLVALALASHQASLAQSLLDYDVSLKDHPDSFSPGGPWTFASSFTAGSQSVDVSSIGFILGSYNTPSSPFQCSAYIFSDNNGQPGSMIGSDQMTLVVSTPQFYDFTFSTALALSAGATYWAAVGTAFPGSGPLYIGASWDLRGYSGYGITPELSLADAGWYPPDSFTVVGTPEALEYRIAGSVVPEPRAISLCLMGVIVIFARLRRR